MTIEYRFADGQYARVTEFIAEFVRRRVAVIAALNSTAAGLAAKAATTEIPIVFSAGTDPVEAELVASLNRPGGNATGVYYLTTDLAEKRLGLLHELLPSGRRTAVLVNPANPLAAESAKKELQSAAGSSDMMSNFSARAMAARSTRLSRRSSRMAPTRC